MEWVIDASVIAWSLVTVSYILNRTEYLGHTVNFKTEKTSFRDKRRYPTPKDTWVIFENTQEPIIDEETFRTVQRLHKTKRRPTRLGETNPLTGLLYCADCGAKMYNARGDISGRNKDNYTCSSYNKRTTECGTAKPLSNTKNCTPTSAAQTGNLRLFLKKPRSCGGFMTNTSPAPVCR